MNYKAANVFV